MNRPGYLLFLGLTLSTAALVTAATGCSSSSTDNSGGSTTTTTTKSTTTTSSTTTMGTGGSAVTLDCNSYCGELMANCTAANEQYTSMAICLNVCAGFTSPGTLADMAGDTLGCRIYHGGAAAGSAANATLHCPHAGPTGGDKDPKGAAGTCGEPCTSFCSIAAKNCPSTFTDSAACMTACQGFKADTATYNDTDTATNDMGCRFYHLSAASASPTAAATHCQHIVTVSATCTM